MLRPAPPQAEQVSLSISRTGSAGPQLVDPATGEIRRTWGFVVTLEHPTDLSDRVLRLILRGLMESPDHAAIARPSDQ